MIYEMERNQILVFGEMYTQIIEVQEIRAAAAVESG
jgi:hypothetical protein